MPKGDLRYRDTEPLDPSMDAADNAKIMIESLSASEKEERPLVTFALFAYNQEKFVREAIEGAFCQTYPSLEIILSDDCSTDNTFHIMEEMAKAYNGPHQVRVRRQAANDGLLNHVCAVISEMRGEIMVLAAGDDVSLAKRVDSIVASWTPDCLGVFSACDLINEHGKILEKNWLPAEGARVRIPWLKKFHSDLFVYGASSSYHKSILRMLPRSETKVYSEDTPINMLIQLHSGNINICKDTLVRYRIHDGAISRNNISYRPGFHEIKCAEKSNIKQIEIQRDILVYLKCVLVPLSSADKWVDLPSLCSDIAFCDLRLRYYSCSHLQRARILLELSGKGWLWALPRFLGLNVYVALRYLLNHVGLRKSRHQGIKG